MITCSQNIRKKAFKLACDSVVWSVLQDHILIQILYLSWSSLNTLRPRQNGPFPDDIFKWIFLNENVWIPIKISLKFVPKGPINNITAMVQIMAWRRPGDKPLSEPMMVSLPTHICVAWPQWVNWYCAITYCITKKVDPLFMCTYIYVCIWMFSYSTKHNMWYNGNSKKSTSTGYKHLSWPVLA